MNPYNPYEAPHASEAMFGSGSSEGDAQAQILESMKKTRPWVIFLSILGFLATAACVLGGVIMLIAGAVSPGFRGKDSEMGPILSLVYFSLAAFYAVPSVLLFQYGSSIGSFTRPGASSVYTLAQAIKRQTSFWRFAGISTAVLMGLYFLALIIAFGVGMAKAMK